MSFLHVCKILCLCPYSVLLNVNYSRLNCQYAVITSNAHVDILLKIYEGTVTFNILAGLIKDIWQIILSRPQS